MVLARVRGDELDVVAVDVRTGKVRWRAPWSPGNVWRAYGLSPSLVQDGLSELGDWPGQRIGRVEDGQVQWVRSAEALFDPLHSTEIGWWFSYERRQDRYTGYLHWRPSNGELALPQRGRAVSVRPTTLRYAVPWKAAALAVVGI